MPIKSGSCMDEGQCGEAGGSWNTKSDTLYNSRIQRGE
jgi:hypothetical protein